MLTSPLQPLGPGARLALLANPVARRAGSARRLREAALVLRERYQIDIVSPADPAAIASAARAAAASHDGIVVLGGDGTLNRVVNALGENSTPVGLLPLGTGNDFARAMKIPTDLRGAAVRLLNGRVRMVDLLEVNGHLFCTAGLLGLPADAALSVDRWTRPSSWTRPFARLLGGATYRLAGIRHLMLRGGTTRTLHLRLSPSMCESGDLRAPSGPSAERADPITCGGNESWPHVRVEAPSESVPVMVHDGHRRMATHGVFVANTAVLGGGLVLPLDADESDGRMEVAVIRRMPRLRLWWAFACLAQGWPVPEGVLDIARAPAVEIVSDEELPFTADGDLLCRDTRFAVRVRPCALRVIC
ncbi:MAG: diacylglycerol kinase family protein [Acidobacteriota bacterium]